MIAAFCSKLQSCEWEEKEKREDMHPGVNFINLFAPCAEPVTPYAQFLKSFQWCKSLAKAQKIRVGCKTVYEINPRTMRKAKPGSSRVAAKFANQRGTLSFIFIKYILSSRPPVIKPSGPPPHSGVKP